MLTAKRTFSGETVSDTLAAVLRAEVEWDALPDDTPVLIQRLLRRCLEKDRKRRLHDIADARIDIEEGLAEPAAEVGLPVGIPPPQPLWRRALPWAVAGVLSVAFAVVLWAPWRTGAPPMRFSVEVAPSEPLWQ